MKKIPPVAPAPKPKVEDGIFGTSGGIGFTKQNELFVGRVAMIGFAASLVGRSSNRKGILQQLNWKLESDYERAAVYIPRQRNSISMGLANGGPLFGFTKSNELFVGRLAQLGIAFSLIGEIITGKGALAQLNIETGLPISEIEPLVLFNSNELFVGRLAQLGIAFSLIGEIITGKGALAQLNIETGLPISEIEPLVLFNVAFFFVAALNPGTGKFVTDEDED
ncbi:hypothetical protein Tco_1007054 [Tanacetum coccineum]|uniref:Photosystem II 22 kDa protein n=1 Tax=Tanacetum coccineum TaxID=301880 RepID=A0ABQ5FJM1_9ASTR